MTVHANGSGGNPARPNNVHSLNDHAQADDIARGMAVVHPPDHAIEVRAPKTSFPGVKGETNVVKRFAPGAFRKAAAEAHKLSGRAPAFYVVLNGVDPALPVSGRLGGGAKAGDIPRRLRILFDFDPTRPGTVNATEREKAEAFKLMEAVREYLSGLGFPEPVVADSGNGYHLIYMIDLPNDDESTALVKGVLEAVADRFDTEAAKVDRKVFDAPRLVKLYGTWACKGEDTPDRPARYSRILSAPAELAPVPTDLLRKLVEDLAPTPTPAPAFDLAADIERKRAQSERPEPFRVPAAPANGRPDAETRAVKYLEKCEPAISGQAGHSKAFKAACKVGPGFDLPEAVALDLFRIYYNPRCEPRWSDKEMEHKISEAYRVETRRGWLLNAERNGNGYHQANGKHEGNGRPPGDPPPATRARAETPERIPVEIDTQRHRVLAETLAILRNDPTLFCRGSALVKIAEPWTEDVEKLSGGVRLRKARGSVRIVPVGEAGLSCRVTEIADFYSWFKGKSGEDVAKPVHPPSWLVKAVLEHGSYPGVRPLEGVVEVPFPRPDGTLVTEPGYDPATGFYYSPSVTLDPIPDRPTQADAKAAADLLLNVVKQFPFGSDDDRAVWLAYGLTVIGRPAIDGAVPGTAFNGNKAGTGKGRLIDGGSTIANNRAVPTTTYPRDEAEAEKIKVAFALAGTQIAHLDNIEEGKTYGGGVIDSALTTTECGGRILGLSKNVEGLSLRTIWVISGNNISPVKDAHRRWLVCNLVTDLERPEERGDLENPDLLGYIREHRSELVRAALVILRAHAVAGWPTGGWAPLGSYEQWDRIIRGAVWFATGLDCNATRRKAAEDSPDRLNKLALLEAWKELPGGGPGGWGVTSEEACRMAIGDKDKPAPHPALAEVLMRFSRNGKIETRSIGNVIRGMRGQNFNGMAFRSDRDHKRSACWYVDTLYAERADSQKTAGDTLPSGESGESGECVSNQRHAPAEHKCDVNTNGDKAARNGDGLEQHSPDSPDSPPDDVEEFTL